MLLFRYGQHPALMALGSLVIARLVVVVAADTGMFSWGVIVSGFQHRGQNILGRMRTIALGKPVAVYRHHLGDIQLSFRALNVLGGIFLAVFVINGGLTILVYSQMCRDATLSHITNTEPGALQQDGTSGGVS